MTVTGLLLPEGTRLLHIGPHKTGTTTVQGALWQARQEMRVHGVVYPGKGRQHTLAARAVTAIRGPKGKQPATPGHWNTLVREVAGAREARVVVSSESFANADDVTVQRVVEALGGDRVHVVVTLRPLAKIMPSAWQQYVREGLQVSYEAWLRGMLDTPPYTWPTSRFWQRHRHDELVDRWASMVGTDKLTVVVADESDRQMLLRVFERMVGLPSGLLRPHAVTNPSLMFGEVEVVRRINKAFHRRNWPDELYDRLVRKGFVRHLQLSDRPVQEEQRISLPTWAAERAARIGSEAAARIEASGVRIIGDISTLGYRPERSFGGPEGFPRPVLPSDVAAEALVATILAALGDSPDAATGTATRQPVRAGRVRLTVGRRRRVRRVRLPGPPPERDQRGSDVVHAHRVDPGPGDRSQEVPLGAPDEQLAPARAKVTEHPGEP